MPHVTRQTYHALPAGNFDPGSGASMQVDSDSPAFSLLTLAIYLIFPSPPSLHLFPHCRNLRCTQRTRPGLWRVSVPHPSGAPPLPPLDPFYEAPASSGTTNSFAASKSHLATLKSHLVPTEAVSAESRGDAEEDT